MDIIKEWLIPAVLQCRSLRQLQIDPGYDIYRHVDLADCTEEEAVVTYLQCTESYVGGRLDNPEFMALVDELQHKFGRRVTPMTQPMTQP